MKKIKISASAGDKLWSGMAPLLKSPFALVALRYVRRNPKTAIALGVATAAGAVLAGVLARSGQRAELRKRHEIKAIEGPGHTMPVRTNGSVAATQ